LKVTIRKFYRANGASTQLKGMVPDVVLPSVNNELDAGEGTHEYALPWDEIPSAEFVALGRIQPHVDELRRRSDARQAADKDWAYTREDIELYRKMQADKSVSLNLAQRLKEREESEARVKARKDERAARPKEEETSYELTLKLAAQPGLPAPVGTTNAAPVTVEEDSVAPTAAGVAGSGEEDAEESDKTPFVDVTLKESKRILLDLIELTRTTNLTPPVAARR
jgi:carboxyl-terminal processing protease